MTIHSAKGLEFPIVFITGLEEGLFPSEMTSDSPRALEEERRLFYVALTRAERQVVLTYAKSRFRNGKMEYSRPSRFIREIPQEFFRAAAQTSVPTREESLRSIPRIEQRMKPLRSQSVGSSMPVSRPVLSSLSESDLSVGRVVVHERFGKGVVQVLEGTGIDAKATVAFENAGTKVLMLRFAKLTMI